MWNENRQMGNTSLFHSTFFKSGEVAYSKKDYQIAYARYAVKYIKKLNILSFFEYQNMSEILKYVQNNEFNVVKNYMNSKRAAILNSAAELEINI